MDRHAWLWLLPLFPLLGSALAGTLHLLTLRARNNLARGELQEAQLRTAQAVVDQALAVLEELHSKPS